VADEIHVTGSIGTNQYTDDADIDVHIVIDESKIRDSEFFQKDVFKYFREEGNIVYVKGHPIEVYLQYNPTQEFLAEAVYNLLNDTWIIGPKIVSKDYDPYEDFSDVFADVKELAGEADTVFGELKRDIVDYYTIEKALNSLSGDVKKKLLIKLRNKVYEIENSIEDLKKTKLDWIHLRRQSSKPVSEEEALKDVGKAKEWREANAIFKYLSRYKYIKTISKLETMLEDEKLDQEDLNTIRQMMGTERV